MMENKHSAFNSLPNLKVLMIEDNELNQLLTRRTLKKIGWDVDTALNGIEALEKLRTTSYDLVLMDIQMPEPEGIEATRMIRNQLQNEQNEVPIIACTPQTSGLKKWLEAGVNDYISNVFNVDELVRKVTHLIDKKRPVQQKNNFANTSGNMENMQANPIINLHNLYTFSGNSSDTVKSIIEVFLAQAPEQIQLLVTLIEQKDWNAVKILSHKMKSSYAIIGANSVRSILQTIEDDCTQNSVNEAKFKVLLADVISLNEKVINYIRPLAGL
jgi:CheY-like chemotaxis protein/HPt (histidine-containing phosphotransfer) domain-containing protein